jgi:hypothetical protein
MVELVAVSITIKPDRLLWRYWLVTTSILLVLSLFTMAGGLIHPGKSIFNTHLKSVSRFISFGIIIISKHGRPPFEYVVDTVSHFLWKIIFRFD